MEIYKLLNDTAHENTYFLVNKESILLIDPGSNGSEIVEKIISLDRPVAAILLTHTHYDHIMSLDLVRDSFDNPPVYVSEEESSWLYSPLDNLSGQPRHSDMEDVIMRPADCIFQYKEAYNISDFNFNVVQTPGHSWGGVSFVFPREEMVITGDALFRETIGRTDLPTSNFEELVTGIRKNLFSLPNHYKVYPGHGMDTTISHEKNFNPFFQ